MAEEQTPADPRSVLGRYRYPLEIRKFCAAGVLVGIASTVFAAAVAHRPVWSHVLLMPIGYAVFTVFAWTVPMTVISESGIRRWWSTQKSHVQWTTVSDVISRPVSRNEKYPVHALLKNGDDIVLIGVPTRAVGGLRRLAAVNQRSSA